MLFITFILIITAYMLGQTWMILQRRWPECYAIEHCRKPYPEIAYRAFGIKAK